MGVGKAGGGTGRAGVSGACLSSAVFNLQSLGRGRDWIVPILPPLTPRQQEAQGQGSGQLVFKSTASGTL